MLKKLWKSFLASYLFGCLKTVPVVLVFLFLMFAFLPKTMTVAMEGAALKLQPEFYAKSLYYRGTFSDIWLDVTTPSPFEFEGEFYSEGKRLRAVTMSADESRGNVRDVIITIGKRE